MEVPTVVTVGENHETYLAYTELAEKLTLAEKDLDVLENDMILLKNDPSQLQMVEEEYQTIKETINTLEENLQELTKGCKLEPPVLKIAVLRALFPGVTIYMGGAVFNVSNALKGPLMIFFNKSKGKITIRKLAKTEIFKIKKQFKKWLEQEEDVVE